MPNPSLLFIGASSRGGAASASRAGFAVASLDLFADRDLQAVAAAERIDRYPDSMVAQAQRWPGHIVLLAGGMENLSHLIGELSLSHRIAGPNREAMQSLRSLDCYARWTAGGLGDCPIRLPEVIRDRQALRREHGNGEWLWKPYRGAGGGQIVTYRTGMEVDFSQGYLQKRIVGTTLGMTFMCWPGKVEWMGAMQNLTPLEVPLPRRHDFSAASYLYAGSRGPISIAAELRAQLCRWIQRIADETGHRGWLQGDFVWSGQREVFFLEFNPRWSASMELIEWWSGRNLVHDQLFAHDLIAPTPPPEGAAVSWNDGTELFKFVLYAANPFVVSSSLSDRLMVRSFHTQRPLLALRNASEKISLAWADVPVPGTRIEKGEPIASVLGVHRQSASVREFASELRTFIESTEFPFSLL